MNATEAQRGTPVFGVAEAEAAREAWGANCGPGALAAVLGLSLDVVRPALEKFDEKHYTNPAMMRGALRRLSVNHTWRVLDGGPWNYPMFGLARVQWEGPWTKPGVPMKARYRHTHWIGARNLSGIRPGVQGFQDSYEIFDINCICVGGWVSVREWETQVVPWLLKQVESKADGGFHLTHTVEISQPPAGEQEKS